MKTLSFRFKNKRKDCAAVFNFKCGDPCKNINIEESVLVLAIDFLFNLLTFNKLNIYL